MSAGYDGNIKLGVSVTADSKSVVAELGALRKQIVDMFSSVDKSLTGGSGSFSNLEKTLTKTTEAVKEVGTAAQKSGEALKSAFNFDVETASTEELYQKLKQIRAEAEEVKKQMLSEGYTSAQVNNSKEMRVRNSQMSAIASELRDKRGLSDTSDYAPAMNFQGDVGDAQVKNLENALAHAYEALQYLQSGLATMSETDDGFEERTARVTELTNAIASLNEQLGLEKAKLSGAGTSTDGEAPKTVSVSAHNMGYDVSGIKYTEIYSNQGKEAAEAFINKYNEILSSEGRKAAEAFATSFNTAGGDGNDMIAQYKRELAGLQSRMKDFDKLKITMSDEDVGKTLLRIEELKTKIAELTRDAKDMNLDVPMDDGLRDTLRQAEELRTKMKQFNKDGTGFSDMAEAQTASTRLAGLSQAISEYFRNLDPAQQKLADFKQALADISSYKERSGFGKTVSPEDVATYEAASAKAKQYKSDLGSLIQMRNALSANIKQFEKTGLGMNAEELKQSKILLAEINQQCGRLAGTAEGAASAIARIGALDKPFFKLRSTIGTLIKQTSKLAVIFRLLGKHSTTTSKDITKGMKRALTTTVKMAFGVRGLFALFRRLRSTAIESLKAIASQFPHINKQFSETKTLLSGLKGSFGTMLTPLITAVLPAINQIISALTSAIQLTAKFFAVLSGGGVIYKATAQQQDFAESLKGAGGAAKEAMKSLMGFDELNVLQDNSSSGAGGAEWDFEEEMVDPNTAVSKFAEMVKKAWETGDFFDVGQFLAESLRDGLNKLDSWITSEGTAIAEKVGNSLATLINGIVSVAGLAESAGRTLADALNMITVGLHQFLVTTDWVDVGKFVADTVMSFFDNVNWAMLGQTVGGYIMAFVDSIYGFITNIDFKGIGQYVATAINNIFDVMGEVDDTGLNGWQKLGQSISDSITGLLEMILSAVREVDWSRIGQAIGGFIESIDFGAIIWDVTALVANLVSAIAESIVNWAKTEPISAAITTLLGVAMLGVKVAPAISTVVGWFGKLGEVFAIVNAGAGTFKEAISLVFGPGSLFAGIGMVIGGAVTAISSFFSMLSNGFSWLKEILMVIGIAIAAVGAIILGAPALVAGVIAAIVAAVATLIVVIKEHWSEICEWVSNAIKVLSETFSKVFTSIRDAVVGKFNDIKTKLTEAMSNLRTSLSNTLNNIKTMFVNIWTGIKNSVTNIINGMKNAISGVVTGIKNAVSGIATTVKNTINAVIRALNGLSFTVPDWVPGDMGGKRFGFNIPYLANGAVIPPNKEFMAVLGDQKHGTNIEAPLDTIKEAVAEELTEYIDAMMTGFQAVVDAINDKDFDVSIGDTVIGKAAERYRARQALVRGTT